MRFATNEAVRQLFAELLDVLQATPHEALDRNDGIQRITGRSLLGTATDFDAVCVIADRGWQDDLPVGIRQGLGNTAAHSSDQRVGSTQVDSHRQAALVRLGAQSGFGDLQ
ncbi:NAD-specific glutamate dehydrogenase [compost metagenome]